MDIDWSSAPEGATHWERGCRGESAGWMRKDGGEWFFLSSEGRWIKYIISYIPAERLQNMVPRPDSSPAWTGEGLPPVGTVCEVRADHIREGYWTEVKVLALGLHEKDVAVLVAEHSDGMVDEMHCLLYTRFEDHFRPIKTKEQIEAEERESEVSHIERCITNLKVEHQNNPRVIAEVLHNIGYRKQENN